MEEPVLSPAEDAGLTTISIGKLLDGDAATKKGLLHASKDLGFFYVDVRDHPSGDLVQSIERVTETAFEFYGLPQEEKDTWEVNQDHKEGEEIIMG